MSTARKQTQRAEMVETHNMALSIKRLRNTTPYDTDAWKRALYHALLLEGPDDYELRKSLREAMKLP